MFLHVISAVLLGVVTQTQFGWIPLTESTSAEISPYYRTLTSFHLRIDKNLPPDSVLFIGDSHIQGLAVSAIHPLGVNYGIGKDTSYGVLKRLPNYQSLHHAKVVVLAVGINDFKFRGPDEIVNNLSTIVESLPKSVKVLLCGVHPIDEHATRLKVKNSDIEDLNQRIQSLTRSYPNIWYASIHEKIVEGGQLSQKYHVGDGVHLNSAGYAIWISEIKQTLEKIYRE